MIYIDIYHVPIVNKALQPNAFLTSKQTHTLAHVVSSLQQMSDHPTYFCVVFFLHGHSELASIKLFTAALPGDQFLQFWTWCISSYRKDELL